MMDSGGGAWVGISAAAGNSFTTIQTPAGTSPVASTSTDTLTLTTANSILTITGNSATDTVAFAIVESAITHNNIGGLTTGDPHTQYALLAGRSGGQTLIGGTAASNSLTLKSTSNATKGSILFGTSCYDEVNNWLGIGTVVSVSTERAQFYFAPTAAAGTYQTINVLNAHVSSGANSSTQKGLNVNMTDYSNSGTLGTIIGVDITTNQSGSADFANAIGTRISVNALGDGAESGSFTTAKGIDITLSVNGSGVIGTAYGIYINDMLGNTNFGIWQNSTTNPNRFGGEVRIQGDTGGAASHNTFTGTSNIAANSTGVGTILFKGTTNRNSTGFIKIYIGTTAYYVPVFSAITG